MVLSDELMEYLGEDFEEVKKIAEGDLDDSLHDKAFQISQELHTEKLTKKAIAKGLSLKEYEDKLNKFKNVKLLQDSALLFAKFVQKKSVQQVTERCFETEEFIADILNREPKDG